MARSRRARTPWGIIVFVLFAGAILGAVVAESVRGYPAVAFLGRDLRVGLDPPFTVDMWVVTLTLGGTVRLNLAAAGGMVLAVWLFRLLS